MTTEHKPLVRLDDFWETLGIAVITVDEPDTDRAQRIIEITYELSRQNGLECGKEGEKPFIHQGITPHSMAHALEHHLVVKFQASIGVCYPITERPLDQPGERQYFVHLKGWLNDHRRLLDENEFRGIIDDFNKL